MHHNRTISFTRSDDHAHSAGTDATQLADTSPGPSPEALGASGNAAVGRILQSGEMSYYGTSTVKGKGGDGFAGREMADGEKMDPTRLTVAHMTYPFGTRVTIRSRLSGHQLVATVTDRGPYENATHNLEGGPLEKGAKPQRRILDGSVDVADALGYKSKGVDEVDIIEADQSNVAEYKNMLKQSLAPLAKKPTKA